MPSFERIKESIKSGFFILGSSIICFIALRNTLTWHFQRFWGASGDLWQDLYNSFYGLLSGNEYYINLGTFLVHFSSMNILLAIIAYTVSLYWTLSLIFMSFDYFNVPKCLLKYKMQPGKNEPVDLHKLGKVAMVVSFNHLLSLPVMYLYAKLLKWRGVRYEEELPVFQKVVLDLIVFILFEEIGFYYFHRLFHTKMFYKRFHKLHHDWQAPVAMAAIYAHPLEHLLANLFPMLIGPFLMRSHVATILLWNTMVTFSTINAHCGFHFPFFPSPEAHDFHHLKFTNCFGMLGVLDRLHNTDENFRRTPMFKRHMMMLTFTPAREVFPDEKISLVPSTSVVKIS